VRIPMIGRKMKVHLSPLQQKTWFVPEDADAIEVLTTEEPKV